MQVRAICREVLRDRDIVLVDQRGTGKSNPLDCRSEANTLREAMESDEQSLARLKTCLAGYDADVRYDGDEFIVVLSGCGADEAERKRMELQRTVDELLFEARPGRRLPLAISVGAAVYPQDGDTYEALLADRQKIV